MRWLSSIVLLTLAGCECATPRCGTGARCFDAGLDAPGLDVPGLDAPGLDAPELDAPIDAGGDAPDAAIVDPGLPVFPDVIDHLSFAVLTGPGVNDGTDDNSLSLCLNASTCLPMNVADVDDFRIGEMDVYHFDGVDLPRSAVDRVEIRSVSGVDAWRVACVEVRFDGEPVHCSEGAHLLGNGTAAGESETYRDPLGLHAGCTTCYPATATHGPLVGAVTESSATIEVRTDATRRVTVWVSDEDLPASTRWLAGIAYPSPDDDFVASLDVTGLVPAHGHRYEVEVDGVRTGGGRFETAPPAFAPSAFRVALGSCARLWDQPIFGSIAATDPDVFLFLGDNHYANSPDLGSLWWFYRRALEVPERAALLATTSTIAIWDDHDFVGNNTDRTSPGRDAALRAFEDYWAQPPGGLPTQPGIFTRVVRGDVDFFLLDDRYQRDPPATSGGRILGATQEAWLIDELSRSTATFHFLVSGSIFSATGGETWLEYPTSRAALFSAIESANIGGVILLSGDIHRSHLRRIHHPSYEIPEIVSSPLANTTSTCSGPGTDGTQTFCGDGGTYFATLEIDTTLADPRVVARIHDAAGAELAAMTLLRSELE